MVICHQGLLQQRLAVAWSLNLTKNFISLVKRAEFVYSSLLVDWVIYLTTTVQHYMYSLNCLSRLLTMCTKFYGNKLIIYNRVREDVPNTLLRDGHKNAPNYITKLPCDFKGI